MATFSELMNAVGRVGEIRLEQIDSLRAAERLPKLSFSAAGQVKGHVGA